MSMYLGKARNDSEPSIPMTIANILLELLCAVAMGSMIAYMLVEWACQSAFY